MGTAGGAPWFVAVMAKKEVTVPGKEKRLNVSIGGLLRSHGRGERRGCRRGVGDG